MVKLGKKKLLSPKIPKKFEMQNSRNMKRLCWFVYDLLTQAGGNLDNHPSINLKNSDELLTGSDFKIECHKRFVLVAINEHNFREIGINRQKTTGYCKPVSLEYYLQQIFDAHAKSSGKTPKKATGEFALNSWEIDLSPYPNWKEEKKKYTLMEVYEDWKNDQEEKMEEMKNQEQEQQKQEDIKEPMEVEEGQEGQEGQEPAKNEEETKKQLADDLKKVMLSSFIDDDDEISIPIPKRKAEPENDKEKKSKKQKEESSPKKKSEHSSKSEQSTKSKKVKEQEDEEEPEKKKKSEKSNKSKNGKKPKKVFIEEEEEEKDEKNNNEKNDNNEKPSSKEMLKQIIKQEANIDLKEEDLLLVMKVVTEAAIRLHLNSKNIPL